MTQEETLAIIRRVAEKYEVHEDVVLAILIREGEREYIARSVKAVFHG